MALSRYLFVIFIVVFLLMLNSSYGDMGVYADDFLKKMVDKKAAVFSSQCKGKADGQYTASLIFEIGSAKGLLIESRNKVVINLATVTIENGGSVIEETQGGVYSYERVKKLADELRGYGFYLLAPIKMNALESINSNDICLNVP